MKKTISSLAGVFNPRGLTGFVLCSIGTLLAVLGFATTRVNDAFGESDINLITGPETSPRVTQAEGTSWGHGNTVVVAYVDSSGSGLNPPSLCGVSVSTNGGATFTRLPNKFNESGPCYGEGSVLYSVRAAKWHVRFLSGACGPTGIGQWISPDGINWTSNGCPAVGDFLDLPTTWVDNNPVSPFYGRQYLLFNDYSVGTATRLTVSTDDGAFWSSPILLSSSARRAVKVIGSLGNDGTIFAQVLDEGGGGLNGLRSNFIYRSTDGGSSFPLLVQNGPSFLGPGRSVALGGYYVGMYNTPVAGYWNDMGFGSIGVGPNNVVHYVYAARTASPADPGNIYYVRSTDNGQSWSTPLQLNTDTTTRAQWNPALAVNAQGVVSLSWYDERNTSNDSLQRFARASLDNGATWGSEMLLSDVVFPKPLQPDTGIQQTYVGWFPRASFSDGGYGNEAYHTWTDGRVSINGSPQQDVFFDKVIFAPAPPLVVTTTDDHNDGACNAIDCTLREAITAANQRGGVDIITFAPGVTGTIQLTSALPELIGEVTLQGPGANTLTVRRNSGGNYRIFTITDGDAGAGPVVSISGLTIANGSASGAFPDNAGGGIWNDRATLTLTNCALSNNTASLVGGAIYNYGELGYAGLTLVNCTLGQNGASASGGGIFSGAYHGQTVVNLTNCTISQNTASQYGGAIYNDGTLSGNAALTLTNCTLNQNSGSFGAGGIYNDAFNSSTNNGTAMLTLRNTILRASAVGANLVNDGGTITSQGHNLSSDAAGGAPPPSTGPGGFLNASGDIRNTDPQLSSLANNGGPTQTHALLPGSPAINAGDNALAPLKDQRGYLRAGVSDIGAFEFGGTLPPPVQLVSVVSRQVHGATAFDINLPLTGTPGVECRSGGATGDYKLIFSFVNTLMSVDGASVTNGTGSVSSHSIGSNAHNYIVNLTGVSNAQVVTVSLTNVNDSAGNSSNSVPISIGFLLGDTTGNRTVNASDVSQTKSKSGQAVAASNFRNDVTVSNSINASDVSLVKSKSGTALP